MRLQQANVTLLEEQLALHEVGEIMSISLLEAEKGVSNLDITS